ncbi:MAG TPA: hypothetical protein VLU25_03130 [Acidobacteriota bacterium]|nr:hypothetical protein [Acidobacteriota bacterium]
MTEKPNDTDRRIGQIARIYCTQVLPLRTRSVPLLGRKCRARIFFSFLGYEVKMGRKRVTCPDNVTARYLKIFAELGLKEVEIPYDPTRTAALLPVLERAYEEMNRLLDESELARPKRLAAARAAYRRLRRRLADCGPEDDLD